MFHNNAYHERHFKVQPIQSNCKISEYLTFKIKVDDSYDLVEYWRFNFCCHRSEVCKKWRFQVKPFVPGAFRGGRTYEHSHSAMTLQFHWNAVNKLEGFFITKKVKKVKPLITSPTPSPRKTMPNIISFFIFIFLFISPSSRTIKVRYQIKHKSTFIILIG